MLTRFGTVSVRGFWRGSIILPDGADGTLTDLTSAVLSLEVVPTGRTGFRDDYGFRNKSDFSRCRPVLSASTDGLGNGSLSLISNQIAQFYFPFEIMKTQNPGVYEMSASATVGLEKAEVMREIVIFA